MSEHLRVNLGGNEFESTPYNTTLFTFLGKAAINGVDFDISRVNHVFFESGNTEENTVQGSYLFRTESTAEVYDTIVQFMADNDWPMVINRRDLPQCDYDAYNRMLDQYVANEVSEDFIPEEWFNDGTPQA